MLRNKRVNYRYYNQKKGRYKKICNRYLQYIIDFRTKMLKMYLNNLKEIDYRVNQII